MIGRSLRRHANVDSPASGSGPTITAGWHMLVRVRDGQQVRQYVDGLHTNTMAVIAAGSWTIHKWNSGSMPLFGGVALGRPRVGLV